MNVIKIRWHVAALLATASFLISYYGIDYRVQEDFPAGISILGFALTIFGTVMIIVAIIDGIKTLTKR